MLIVNCKYRKESDTLVLMYNGNIIFGNEETYKILNFISKEKFNTITECVSEYLKGYIFKDSEQFEIAFRDCTKCIKSLLEIGMLTEVENEEYSAKVN